MDKQKGRNILGLSQSATCKDARTAFRKLAKIFHPDRFASDPIKAKIAEQKMKQINEAYHFLLPLLPEAAVEPNPLGSGHARRSTHCKAKKSQGFFSSLATSLKKHRDGIRVAKGRQGADRTAQMHRPVSKKFGPVGRKGKSQFETVFRNAVQHNKGGANPRLQPQNRAGGRYARYNKYFNPVPGRPKSMGPVEAITPVAPVSPVKKI